MKFFLAIGVLLLLTACGHTPTPEENRQLYKVGNPYRVGDRWYSPKEDPYYDEVGEASWYGPGFHGKKTADGEDFDKYDLTAAHRTLPMPSIVRVTNLENGKSANLRINDRGPFARNRIIDVSKKAAEVLGFHLQGMARVRVQFLPEETAALFGGQMPETTLAKAYSSKPRPYTPPVIQAPAPRPQSHVSKPAMRYQPSKAAPHITTIKAAHSQHQQYVQVGIFRKKENAQRIADDVSRFGVAKMEEIHQEGDRFFRVRLGSFSNVKEAERVLNLIQQSGYNDAQFVSY